MLATPSRIEPMARAWRWLRRRDGLVQILIVVGGFEAYEGLRHVMTPNWPEAFANAARVESLERWGHFAWEQSRAAAVPRDAAPRAGDERLLLRRALRPHRRLLHVAVLPLARGLPERAERVPDRDRDLARHPLAVPDRAAAARHVGLTDTLRAFSGIDIGSPHSSPFSNPVAAVPSLHAGFALGVAYGLVKFARRTWVRVLGVVYPLVVVLTIVVTGNHFILDALAGMLVMAVGIMASREAAEADETELYWRLRRGVEQSGSSPGS